MVNYKFKFSDQTINLEILIFKSNDQSEILTFKFLNLYFQIK